MGRMGLGVEPGTDDLFVWRNQKVMKLSANTGDVILDKNPDLKQFDRLDGIDGLSGADCRWRFHAAAASRTLAALTAALDAEDLDVTELHMEKASLEDVFLELTSEP